MRIYSAVQGLLLLASSTLGMSLSSLLSVGEEESSIEYISSDKNALAEILEYAGGKPLILNFVQHNCPKCKKFTPHFDRIAEKYTDDEAVFRNVNSLDHLDMATDLGVTITPTMKVFVDGEVYKTVVGPQSLALSYAVNLALDKYNDEQAI